MITRIARIRLIRLIVINRGGHQTRHFISQHGHDHADVFKGKHMDAIHDCYYY